MDSKGTEILTEPVSEMVCTACHHPLDVAGLPSFISIACPECHATQTVPARLGNFLLVELLGGGGMGAVYRGRDTSLDRWVAVKVMLSTLGSNSEFVETFRREAQAAAALNHPNVVQVYAFGVAQDQPYMVMELLEGGRLDQMIARGEMLDESLVFKMATDVAEGLNAAATIGLIHGDVKPENILIDANGAAKIVDFGLARFKQSAEPGVKGIWGTPYYIAPEKIRGHPGDARSDIYSLGATIFHALTLKPPFEGETPIDVVKARLKEPAPALRSLRPDADPEVETIVARMLEVEPLRRYPTYVSLLADMRKTAARLRPSTAAPSLTKRGGRIVVTRKKGGAGMTVPHASGGISVPAGVGSVGAVTPLTALPEERRPMSRRAKRAWIATGIGLGLLLVAGGVVSGVLYHQREQARAAAAREDRARLEALRKQAEGILAETAEAILKADKSAETARSWKDEAAVALVSLSAATNKISDAAVIETVATNAAPMAAELTQIATGEILNALAELAGMTNALLDGRAAAMAATNAAPAQAAVAGMTNQPALALQKVSALAETIAKGEALFKSLQDLKKKVSTLATIQAEEEERRAREEAERLAREKAEEDKRRQSEELEKQTVAELNLVDQTRKASAPLIVQNQVQQAVDAMKSVGDGLKTEAAKAAVKAAVERYRIIGELKGMVIAGVARDLKANPEGGFRFGWLVGGIPSRDVLGADENKVVIRGGSATWAEVSPAQMLRFVTRYTAADGMSRREAGRYLLGAAAYVVEAGAGSENARKRAADLARDAVNADARLAEKVKALLPEIEGL